MTMQHTTTETFPDAEVVEVLGIVRGKFHSRQARREGYRRQPTDAYRGRD